MTVTIPSPNGSGGVYTVLPADQRLGEQMAFVISREGNPVAYRVSKSYAGQWQCTCPSATVGSGRLRGGHCKHVKACIEIAQQEPGGIEVSEETDTIESGERPPVPRVYAAIAAVQGDLARVGIAKDRQGHQFKFRGIDDVYNALAPLLAQHGLCILPRVVARQQVERTAAKGGALLYTAVTVEFDFVAVADGSRHTVVTVGEAMDSGDKSTNKAMSAAYKYACFQAFCIPTEADNDADATTHHVAPAAPVRQAEPQQIPNIFKSARHRKAVAIEAQLVAQGACEAGQLVEWLSLAVPDAAEWDEPRHDDVLRERLNRFVNNARVAKEGQ